MTMTDHELSVIKDMKASLRNITELLLDIRNQKYYEKKHYNRWKNQVYDSPNKGSWESYEGTNREEHKYENQ